MKISSMMRISFICFYFYCFVALGPTDGCSNDNYHLVRHGWGLSSNCTKIRKIWPKNLKKCLMSACTFSSNLVTFKYERHEKYSCFLYRCQSNNDGTHWNYGWQKNTNGNLYNTHAYALPHPSTKCHNSYFIRKTWLTHRNASELCPNRTAYAAVHDLHSCIALACRKKADALDYLVDIGTCKIMHCNSENETWEYEDYFSNKLRVSDKMLTYILSSHIIESKTTKAPRNSETRFTRQIPKVTTNANIIQETVNKTCNSTNDQIENTGSQNMDFKTFAIVMTGTTVVFFIIGTVIAAYIVMQKFKRKSQTTPRNIPMRSSGISTVRYSQASTYISPYTAIDESRMLQL
ncbi:unnamed protein product, partial [Owenia fusiformis]